MPPKRPAKRICVLLLTAALAVLAGCGSSSHRVKQREPASSASRSSETVAAGTQLIAEADPICARLNAAILARESTLPTVNQDQLLREIVQIVPGTAALERKADGQLARLTAPPAFAEKWSTLLSYRKALASELSELVHAAKHGDATAIGRLTTSKKQTHGRLRELALQSGFKDCAEVGPASRPPPGRSPT